MTELKVVPREVASFVPDPPPILPPEITGGAVQQAFEKHLEEIVTPRPFFSDKEKQFFFTILFSPLTLILWLLAQPVRAFTWVVVKVRTKSYDPEKRVMPCCGFKGNRETNWKSCRVEFTPVAGAERAGLKHICFKCGCDKHISHLFIKADQWLPREVVKVTTIEKAS